ncbi:DUF982 domain-containing protein [Phyllobacterium sp. A18/5-2]
MARWALANTKRRATRKQICVDALAGKVTSTACRNAFIAAAREAGI